MKYIYEYYAGDDWCPVVEKQFDSPREAKLAGVQDGFEYVRVVNYLQPAAPSERP